MAKKANSWFQVQDDVLTRIRAELPSERVRELQRLRPWRHFLTVGRLYLQLFLLAYICWQFTNPWIWLPAAFIQGFTVLGFIILLHEQLHNVIFKKRHPRINTMLGYLYALPSAISSSQFTRWHLDHHANLGSEIDDPKRAHLSPKKNKRWYKLLYFTIALLPIYGRAAKAENLTYPAELTRKIKRQRAVNFAIHLAIAGGIWYLADAYTMLRVHLIPMTVFFPIAFILNRLGQHYWIDPDDPVKWGTRVDGSAPIHFLFLWSNFHIEHHYFPQVPMYNLKALNRELRPFFEKVGMPNRTYPELLWGWLVRNKRAHTNWDVTEPAEPTVHGAEAYSEPRL
ncbi:fatty acid desaturase [bacterium]|nr:fatty acid desaturase [bacterium]